MSKIIFNKWFILVIFIFIAGSGLFYLLKRGEKVIEIKGGGSLIEETQESPLMPINEEENKSSFSGIKCDNYNKRPIAIMLANDSVARPLSGLSLADLVIEMPVITGDITRIMAVFQCESPGEIGSMRSTRHDFIPLAMGLDAILVHWGGSHYALDILKKKVMDNIDALSDGYNTFWREPGFPSPNNGYSSSENINKALKSFGYREITTFEGYLHSDNIPTERKKGILNIGYSSPYNVRYEYNPETNSYLRWRGGIAEKDRINNKQVETKNIIIMRAYSRQLDADYNDVDVEGEGRIVVYKNGEETKGSWQKLKSNSSSKLYFFDENGNEIEFSPGQIWIEIVEPYQKVEWSTENVNIL